MNYNFKKIGKNVRISPKASIYGAENIEIGDNVRIDDFCILSAGKQIKIGSHIHIACYSCLIGRELIELQDCCGISMRVTLLSSSDDYSGNCLVGPVFDEQFLNVKHAPVIVGEAAVLAAGVIVLPGVTIGAGSAVAAHSLVKKDVADFHMVGGVPAKFLFERSKNITIVKNNYLKYFHGDPDYERH